MRTSRRPRTWLCALLLPWAQGSGVELRGPLAYEPDGVVLNGHRTPWRSVAVLEERDATPEELRAELERRRGDAGRSPAKRVELAAWCRAVGLDSEARAELEAVLARSEGYAPARRALGLELLDGRWVDAREVLRPRWDGRGDPSALALATRLDLADFCRDHALPELEWTLLASVLVQDGMNADACARMRARVALRPPTTYAPPLAGRWRASLDRTGHHQRRAWTLFALDLVQVDEQGRAHRGDGRALDDHLGFGAPVYAVADGVVVEVTADTPDQPPGTPGVFGEANTVSVRHAGGEVSDSFHLQRGSIPVAEGDPVRRGQLLGRVGNSGASGAPHLHFEISVPLDGPDGQASEWLGVPFRWAGFRLLEVDGRPCAIEVRAARPQEGWTLLFPEPAPAPR